MKYPFNENILIVFLLLVNLIFFVAPERTKVKVSGVIDRFEDKDQAVILIEEVGEELIVPKRDLPTDSKENVWLIINVNEEGFEVVSIDYKRTKDEQAKTKNLLQELREKN